MLAMSKSLKPLFTGNGWAIFSRRLLSTESRDFKPKNALVLSKVSRYEYERRRLGSQPPEDGPLTQR